MIDPILIQQIERDEGRRACVYRDSRTLLTIGVGCLVDPAVKGAGLMPEEIDFIRDNRIAKAEKIVLCHFYPEQVANDARYRTLVNMAFNLGPTKFAQFEPTWELIRKGDYEGAAQRLEKSLWYRQVGDRGKRIVYAIRTGKDPQ